MRTATACVLFVFLTSALRATAQDLCVFRLQILSPQSPWTGGGNITAPTPSTITTNRLDAAGYLYLSIPTNESACPPSNISATNVVSLMERASLALPTNGERPGVSFRPADIKSNVTTNPTDPTIKPIAVFDFDGLEFGLTGTEPLGVDAVVTGTGSVAEARQAAQPLCSQLLLLNGTLNLTSILGPRTAQAKNVAYNRSMSAGASVNTEGTDMGNVTLYIGNASLFLDISPQNIPGVEVSRGRYLLSGDIVATADLTDADSWFALPGSDADWSQVQRLDAPVVIGGRKTPQPRYIGLNDTLPQQCSPTRTVNAATGEIEAAGPAQPGSASASGGAGTGTSARAGADGTISSWQVLIAAALGGWLIAIFM